MTQISHQRWGEGFAQGSVDLWVLQSSQVRVEVLTLGAIIRSVQSRGKDGQMEDIVLGYDDLEGWKAHNCYSINESKELSLCPYFVQIIISTISISEFGKTI